MLYTVSDFLNSYEGRVRLLAGGEGLSRTISTVGILDYELVPNLKSRYQRVNFEPNQLVLSTFLYARDEPWLIGEAIKYLVSRGASGLVIKNVFHLEIAESALRYANARDFPLFITTDEDFFFDFAIAEIYQRVRELEDASFVQNELDLMILEAHTPEQIRTHALRLNPSFKDENLAVYVAEPLSQARFVRALAHYHESALSGTSNLLAPYDEGLLYIATAGSDVLARVGGNAGQTPPHTASQMEHLVNVLRADVLEDEKSVAIGVSDVHFGLDELARSVLEAKRAALIARNRGRDFAAGAEANTVCYGGLGVVRALLPHANTPEMAGFANAVMEPLRSFDAETNSSLVETLGAYCDAGQSIEAAAQSLGQHPNTVRYRLDKVASLTGLSYKRPSQMEQLSLAHKIELCQRLLEG